MSEVLKKYNGIMNSFKLNQLKIGGMGLINTIARFQLKYKQDITFEIKALENGGTRVVIGGIYND